MFVNYPAPETAPHDFTRHIPDRVPFTRLAWPRWKDYAHPVQNRPDALDLPPIHPPLTPPFTRQQSSSMPSEPSPANQDPYSNSIASALIRPPFRSTAFYPPVQRLHFSTLHPLAAGWYTARHEG